MRECKYSAKYFGATNQGMVRTNNEDTYICQKIWDESHILCAAIDGLGGYEGGEIAAELARLTIIKHLEDFASKKIGELLKASLIAANNEIIRQHEARPKVSQMGCVASVGVIDLSQGIISIAHVGDSRIYQFGNGELKKLTHDHSLVGYREENGELSEKDAMNHPKRNVIDKFLGEQHLNFDSASYVEVSVWPITGDSQYLFCSDGLTDLVTSAQISKILSSEQSVKEKVEDLISSANKAGGKDNITVVITEVTTTTDNNKEEVVQPEIQTKTPKRKAPLRKLFVLILEILIVGGIAYFIGDCAYYIRSRNEERMQTLDIFHDWDALIHERDSLNVRIKILEDSISQLSSDTIDHEQIQLDLQ